MFVVLKTIYGDKFSVDTAAIDRIYPYGENTRLIMKHAIPQDNNVREEHYVQGSLEEVIAKINRQAYPVEPDNASHDKL